MKETTRLNLKQYQGGKCQDITEILQDYVNKESQKWYNNEMIPTPKYTPHKRQKPLLGLVEALKQVIP